MNNLFDIINEANNILLLTHESPDGDAIGSVLTMYYYLNSIDKNVDIIIPEIPFIYSNLLNIDKVKDNSLLDYDLAIILDCATIERIGCKSDVLNKCKTVFVIDHHVSNTNYGDYNLIDGNSPATCQYLYELFLHNHIFIDRVMMECMAVGIVTDTGGFQNSNTNSKTFEIVSLFMQNGIDVPSIIRQFISKKDIKQFNLRKIAIDRLELFHEGKIAFTYIKQDDYNITEAMDGSHEGIVDIGRNILGVEVSIFVRESDTGYKFSLRSNDYVDVSKIARNFNGGGHIKAAGGVINKNFKETRETLINEVIKYLNE